MNKYMYMMIMMSLFFMMIAIIIMLLSNILSKKNKTNFEKNTPFESGFNPKLMNRMPFSLRFFLITIIFLIFDVEISLLLPMLSTFFISNLLYWTMMMFFFMTVLMMGLIYELNQGALNWL